MARTFRKHTRHSERGIALFTAIFTLLLITAIGAGMIMLTHTDTSISANFRDEQKAFFGAKAGMEEVRDRMRKGASDTLINILPTALPGTSGAFVYITNPNGTETVTPWLTNGTNYPDDEVCTELLNAGSACGSNGAPASSFNALSGTALPYTASPSYAMHPVSTWKWTRINVKLNGSASGTGGANTNLVDYNYSANSLVCWNGATEIATNLASCSAVDPNFLPVYVMTTLAVTPNLSRRMVQAEIEANTFPTLPGPMIFDGASPTYSAPSSNAFTVSGNDLAQGPNNGAGCPAPISAPALGAYNAAAVTSLTNDASNRPQSYTGPAQFGNPSVGNIGAELTMLQNVGGLEQLVSEVTLMAGNENNVYGNNPTIANPGTNANPQVNVVNGNVTLSGNWSGSGILLVTGTLTFHGTPSYNGLILVIGQGSVVKDGGGQGVMNGSMLVANLYDSNGNLLSPSSTPGVPNLNWNGGGTVSWNYDSCWSTMMNLQQSWRIVAVRELVK